MSRFKSMLLRAGLLAACWASRAGAAFAESRRPNRIGARRRRPSSGSRW